MDIPYRGAVLEAEEGPGGCSVEIRFRDRGIHRVSSERATKSLGMACNWFDDYLMGEAQKEAIDENTRHHSRRK